MIGLARHRYPEEMVAQVSDSRLSNLSAARIVEGFEEYMTRFGAFNARAPSRFSNADWPGMQGDTVGRLGVYGHVMRRVVGDVADILGDRVDDPMLWMAVKAVYSGLIADRQDWELAETFHNSVTRQVFDTVGVNDRVEFVEIEPGHSARFNPSVSLGFIFSEFVVPVLMPDFLS